MTLRRFGMALGVAAAVAGGGALSAAQAADDGYENVLSSVATAVGLLKADESPPIDYRERAPLVLPPKMQLEKPVPAGVGRTAAWPKDPDVLRRRREAEDARAPSALAMSRDPSVLMSKDELMKRRAGAPSAMQSQIQHCGATGNQRGCLVVNPDELKAEEEHYAAAGFGDKKELAPGEEPPRDYLTQPPHGYWKTTKAVKATTEAPKPQVDEANPYAALVYRKKDDDE